MTREQWLVVGAEIQETYRAEETETYREAELEELLELREAEIRARELYLAGAELF